MTDGYVQSLAHPGGSITGLSLQSTEATAKRFELLKELVPGLAPVIRGLARANMFICHARRKQKRGRANKHKMHYRPLLHSSSLAAKHVTLWCHASGINDAALVCVRVCAGFESLVDIGECLVDCTLKRA